MTSIGVVMADTCRSGELSAYRSGWVAGDPSWRRHSAGQSVVPNICSRAHRPAWLTMARNRVVCPAIQLAM